MTSFRLNQKITIDGKVLPFCIKCVVNTSRNNFTDTAIIEIPNRIPSLNKRISDLIPKGAIINIEAGYYPCLLYTSPSPRDGLLSRMPSSA